MGEFTTEDTEEPISHCRYLLAIAIAWRTWPFVFFKADAALDRGTPAASITTATGVRLPLASRAHAGGIVIGAGCLLRGSERRAASAFRFSSRR